MNTKNLKILTLILSIGIGAFMIVASYGKLIAHPDVLNNFSKWGLPSWSHYPVGIAELLGGIGLFFPKTRRISALILAIVLMGAVYVHIVVDQAPTHSIKALAVIVGCALIIYLTNKMKRV